MMSRLKPLKPEDMNPEQLKYHEVIMDRPVFKGLPKNTPLAGPYNAWIRSPALIRAMMPFSQYVREEGILETRLVELAIITVGRVWSSVFEFAAHAPNAVKAGIHPEVVAAIRRNEEPRFEKDDEAAVYSFAKELAKNFQVEDETYRKVVEQIGEQGLVELIGLMGFYVMVCMTLNTFEVPVSLGLENPFTEK
jgi:4-carboxymuconolactone decarboxylase